MSERSLTMTRAQILRTYERAADRNDCLEDGIVAVAREAERRLIAKLRAVPAEKLGRVLLDLDPYPEANAVVNAMREALIAAVTGGDE